MFGCFTRCKRVATTAGAVHMDAGACTATQTPDFRQA